jgi:Host cell surface-exposed lipoprotein
MSVDQQDRDQNAGESGWQPQPHPQPEGPQPQPKKSRWRWIIPGVLTLIVGASIGSALSDNGGDTQTNPPAASQPRETTPAPSYPPVEPPTNEPTVQAPTPVDEAPSTPKPKPKPKPSLTAAQENAIESAKDYLDLSGFSRKGLIDQLKYEGYSTKDATFAVDYIKVNWNKQAAKSAKDYLDMTSFSRQGLIEQLEYEGFTHSQAVYGVGQTGL